MRARLPTALLALACVTDAAAAGLDCRAAARTSERAICADATLRQRDATLAGAYAQALAAAPDLRATVRRQQRAWLQTRDRCGADVRCLGSQYDRRIADFGAPDPTDLAALDELRRAVEAARRTHPDLPVETALSGLKIQSGTTWFSDALTDADAAATRRFPQVRPDGVSAAEWRALLASHIDGARENGRAGYLLIDLDGDGLRDLVIESDLDLDGAGHIVRILRQAGGSFGKFAPASPDADPSVLYTLFERGASQSAGWIRLRGRVYAAFRDGQYGADHVYLLRPWWGRGQLPRLSVGYRYRLSVPALQKPGAAPATRLEPARQQALDAALKLAAVRAAELPNHLSAKPSVKPSAPICPVAADADEDVRQASTGYGPAPYTMQAIADVPVRIGGQCYIGQLRDWFGAYTPGTGLGADLCIRKPEEPGPSTEACYMVQGPRSVTRVSTGMAPFDAIRMMPMEP